MMNGGDIVRAFHATAIEQLLVGSPKIPASSGILRERYMRTGPNGHNGVNGVFVHGHESGAAYYVLGNRKIPIRAAVHRGVVLHQSSSRTRRNAGEMVCRRASR